MGILEDNLKILSRVQDKTGCDIVLALKGFSMFSLFPMIKQYLKGTSASSLDEARLGFEELGKEVHVCAPAYSENDLEQLTKYASHIVFNSFSQTITHFNELAGGWIKYPAEKDYIEGTRYLHDDFRNGNVFYDGNSKSLQLPLRLNLHNDEFEFMKNDSVYAFAEPNRIDK